MKRIGLVIQGPLLSYGRPGNKMHESPGELLREGGLVHYDCRQNIQRIITDFGHLFDEIVVSTWDNELKPGDAWRGAKVVSAPDPGGIKQGNNYKDNNKYRQFISTLNGLVELEKSGVDYAVKTRTDIYLDLKQLVDSFLAGTREPDNSRAIYVPVVDGSNFKIHDLYFAGRLSAMKEFCEAVLAYDKFEFIASVHREMVLKHAYACYRRAINAPDWAYFPIWPPGGVNAATRRIFEYMFSDVYRQLSSEVMESAIWRGVRFSDDHVAALLMGNPSAKKYSIPELISIDWERYFSFRFNTSGRGMSIGDRAKIKIGKVGWRFWSFVRGARKAITSAIGVATQFPTVRQRG